MPVCYFCGKDVGEVKRCKLCTQLYCKDHFLPGTHDCPRVPIQNPYEYKFGKGNELVSPEELGSTPIETSKELRTSKEGITKKESMSVQQQQEKARSPIMSGVPNTNQSNKRIKGQSGGDRDNEDYVYTDGTYFWHRKEKKLEDVDAFDPDEGVEIPGILWPRLSETVHFIIASILILLLVGSSFLTRLTVRILVEKPRIMPLAEYIELIQTVNTLEKMAIQTGLLALFFLLAFLTHELSHRQTARHYNVQTKFRLFRKGVIMIIIFLFLPIKMALPGAVVIIGLEKTSRETAMCKIAGPLANIVQGLILVMLVQFLPMSSFWTEILTSGAIFNFSLALFNLLPFGILDGKNIRDYDKKMWLSIFLSSIFLLLLSIIVSI